MTHWQNEVPKNYCGMNFLQRFCLPMILGSSSRQLEGLGLQKTHPGRLATPFDTKKEPEHWVVVDKETCVEKY